MAVVGVRGDVARAVNAVVPAGVVVVVVVVVVSPGAGTAQLYSLLI